MLRHYISPSYTHQKLEPPFYRDIVDVFEDRMRGWLLYPALRLAREEDCSVASVALATSYFERIEIYLSGKDSSGKSKAFFRRGFLTVFPLLAQSEKIRHGIADAMYEMLRCGFAHDAMFRNGIYFMSSRQSPLTFTWPRKNGVFDEKGRLESVIIHPKLFIEAIEQHFTSYIQNLRRGDTPTRDSFMAAVEVKWRLGEPAKSIGMSERELLQM